MLPLPFPTCGSSTSWPPPPDHSLPQRPVQRIKYPLETPVSRPAPPCTIIKWRDGLRAVLPVAPVFDR